ncbi:MAG: hypothetical protein JHC95_17025 [Solirubrobacteraceae bacterium]|nr:hypothetical protein [Solirubrobacteraceae bacterium]
MRLRVLLLLGAVAVLAGCGEEGEKPATAATSTAEAPAPLTVTTPAAGRAIDPEDVETAFRALLRDAGVDLQNPTAADVPRTWQVVRDFAAVPVRGTLPAEEEGDAVLAQYGGGPEEFTLDMTRQLIFGDRGDEDMAQLMCSFVFEPTPELDALGASDLWSIDRKDLGTFFVEALAMRGFAGVNALRADPVRLDVDYGGL